MIACAASYQSAWPKLFTQLGRPAKIFSTGSGSMITPVENGNTCSGLHPTSADNARHTDPARLRPSSPVPALALPVLITSARTGCPDSRCARATITGAAQKRFWVNTAVTSAPASSAITSKSLRPGFLILASVIPRNPFDR